jgi:hypothetical protein
MVKTSEGGEAYLSISDDLFEEPVIEADFL